MSPLLFFLLILATAALGAYTYRFQGAAMFWGGVMICQPSNYEETAKRVDAGLKPALPRLSGLESESEDVIVPAGQKARSVLYVIGTIAVPALALEAYSPSVAIKAAALGLLIQLLIHSMLPHSSSDFFKERILVSLRRRYSTYAAHGDAERTAAAEYLIGQLSELTWEAQPEGAQ